MRAAIARLAAVVALAAACVPPAERVRPDDLRRTRPGATALVVVYSRSGHTASAGTALAEALGADYLRLQGGGNEGDGFFSTPSWDEPVPVHPDRVDLGAYRIVLIGTPVWYWKPSALVVSFVEANDFAGRDVVLFHTNEGGIRQAALDRWKERVELHGGRVRDVFGVDRKALRGVPVADAVRQLVAERREKWGR